ncbi:aldose epimerase family protein [Rhizobium sp. SSA_523]|uniref:aldose epimerase family protein n=1 Tax=Rhizobium sp. SSA_523 TaxID=2952477 RepID=UPI002091A5EE|nr:aldose epimerase family protein [Rhizobium sp. SSA_523]MCO5733494.1 galactose mutarotase [Rhizobium sp. SSA_523]WKC23201.1 aldose epimerase family protein [Rhizobium sp. SSA_523]
MTTQGEIFGTTPQGETVYRVKISGGGLTAHVMSWGAVIQDLRLDGHDAPLVLGFDRFEDYPAYSSYFGATPGRVANRIGKGQFTLDGQAYQLDLNQNGNTHLHGGRDGLGRTNWAIIAHSQNKVMLQVTDPDGRAGYPGNCTVTATYELKDDGTLNVVYESVTDQPTLANICQHTYFNLDGRDDILGHDIMIAADHYLELDENQVPTGRQLPVAGTPMDLRQLGPVRRSEANGAQVDFDHNYCLSDTRVEKRSVALVRSVNSGVAMEVRTTEPGVQLYCGFKLKPTVPGLFGKLYGPYAGLCLETQIWPDAINHEGFPSAVLRPGEVLRQETDYVFSKS